MRAHLGASADYQRRLARFLENHDEPRAAGVFPRDLHEVAAVVTYLTPGLRFFYHGQLDGNRVHVTPHLVRAPEEPVDEDLHRFYERLLAVLREPIVRRGDWQLLDSLPAWSANRSCDDIVAWSWQDGDDGLLLAVVNVAAHQSQAYIPVPFERLRGRDVCLVDRMHPVEYERRGDDLFTTGLYLDLPGRGYHVFAVQDHDPGPGRPGGTPVADRQPPEEREP